MTMRTMTMFMNDFGMNRGRASPVLRVTKPATHAFAVLMAVTDAVADATERGVARYVARQRHRRTYGNLSQLNDHMLRDIGFTREGLPGQVAGRVVPSVSAQERDVTVVHRF